MGFSRYCPSSLDLTNFVVREPSRSHRGATAEECSSRSPPRPDPGLDLGIWKSGDLEIQKFGIQKIKKKSKFSKFKSVLPKMSARSGLVGKKSSRPYLGPSEAIFSIGRKNQKNTKILPIFIGGPMGPYSPGVGPCCYPPEVGK